MLLPILAALVIPVTMVSTVFSGSAKPGDAFTFKTTRTVTEGAMTIPEGTLGHGTVTAVSAAAGTHRGSVTLQPEYLDLLGGRRLNVSATTPQGLTFGARRHLFPFPVPFTGVVIVGAGVNPGGNVTIGPGTTFSVVAKSDSS